MGELKATIQDADRELAQVKSDDSKDEVDLSNLAQFKYRPPKSKKDNEFAQEGELLTLENLMEAPPIDIDFD